jgi:hypothetical protein
VQALGCRYQNCCASETMGSSALADFGGGDVRCLCFLMYVPRSEGDAASERVHLFIYLLLQQRYYRPNAKFITTETKKKTILVCSTSSTYMARQHCLCLRTKKEWFLVGVPATCHALNLR